MQETIIPKDKRFITVKDYQRLSGLSYPTVINAIKTGQIRAIQTEGGHFKIDTQADSNPDNAILLQKLDSVERKLAALVKQFRTEV